MTKRFFWDVFSTLLLKSCHSVQYPLEGCKKQENGRYFKNLELKNTTKVLIPAYFPFTGVRTTISWQFTRNTMKRHETLLNFLAYILASEDTTDSGKTTGQINNVLTINHTHWQGILKTLFWVGLAIIIPLVLSWVYLSIHHGVDTMENCFNTA